MADALSHLDPEQRALLWLREVEGQSYEELAEILGIPVGTVKSRLFTAREELRGIWNSKRVPRQEKGKCMTCNESAPFISALCDGEQIPREAATHLDVCPDCRARLADYVQMGVELKRIASETASESAPMISWGEQSSVKWNLWHFGRQPMQHTQICACTYDRRHYRAIRGPIAGPGQECDSLVV